MDVIYSLSRALQMQQQDSHACGGLPSRSSSIPPPKPSSPLRTAQNQQQLISTGSMQPCAPATAIQPASSLPQLLDAADIYNRISQPSICSMNTNGSSLTGLSPSTSLAAPLLDNSISMNTTVSNTSPPNQPTFQIVNFNRVSERSSRSSPRMEDLGSQQGSEGASSHASGPASPPASCPTSIVVSATTDATQAAGLVNFALAQPGVASFVLVAPLGPPTSPGSQASLCAALRVAVAARRIHHSTHPSTDLAIHPRQNTTNNNVAASGSQDITVDLHVYHVRSVVQLPRNGCQTLRIELGQNPLLLGMQLLQTVRSGNGNPQGLQPVQVVFGPSAARVAMTTLEHAQSQLASCGQEALLLPDQQESATDNGTGLALFSCIVYPTCLLPSTASGVQNNGVNSALEMQQLLERAAASLGPMSSNTNNKTGLGRTSDCYSAYSQGNNLNPAATAPELLLPPSFARASTESVSGLSDGSVSTYAGLPPAAIKNAVQGGSEPNMSAALAYHNLINKYPQYNNNNNTLRTFPTGYPPLPFGSLGMAGVLEAAGAGAMAAVAATAAVQQQQQAAATAAAAAAAAVAAQAANSSAASSARLRARKADWVIVTEDTAIKNAAGAVAKVLSRMAPQGMCCPVFMERKTNRYTGVVSVAVKAIAVARGYVSNEGTGHDVGFQPYIRGDACACAYGASRPPGAPSNTVSDNIARAGSSSFTRLNSHPLLSSLGGQSADLTALEFLHASSVSGLGGSPLGTSPISSASLFGSSPPLMGMSPPLAGGSPPPGWPGLESFPEISGGSGSSSVCGDDDAAQWADYENAELAFDVYKVILPQELPENGNLPVKVTAHSRPGVVSNIISKLVSERGAAVLITAGGRAMHVAMLAIVAARKRLQGQGADILLLPKFVTVDTTSTLGWESVFLRFSIIKWSQAAALAADLSSKLNQLRSSDFSRTSL